MTSPDLKPVEWLGSSRQDVQSLPEDVQDEIGFALFQVQQGRTPKSAKPLKGFGGATILEIVEDYNTDTYRAVYTVRYVGVVYVLHVFQKKSKQGNETPRRDVALIKARLQEAEERYREFQQQGG